MKKRNRFTLIMILMICTAASLVATESRVGSMGGVGYYIHDNSNIFYFPGTLHYYANQAVAELRAKNADNLYTVGVQMERKPGSIVGVYLNRPIDLPQDILMDVTPDLTLDRVISLLYGGKWNNKNWGVILSYASDKTEDDAFGIQEKESARYIGLCAGLSTSDYDLGFNLELPSAKWEADDDEDKWGGTGIGIHGRYFSTRSSVLKLVGIGNLYFGNTTREIGDAEIGYNRLNIAIGGAALYQLDPKNLVVLAVEAFGRNQDKEEVKDGDEYTYTRTVLPGIYLGVESKLKSWLIGRLGARQVYQSIKEVAKPAQGEEVETMESQSTFAVSFGLGIILGDLQLDAMMNEGILFDGPNFISGQNNTLANRISLTYSFNKPGK
ncbi:hypothetical protein JW948_13365 [bacterium]|nr:hypothetical protein [bacterium]